MTASTIKMTINTKGRGFYDLTPELSHFVASAELAGDALINIFVAHTSASLVITENADQNVRHDLETFMSALVKDGDPRFLHNAEGPDDMAAHIRSVLTRTSVQVPIVKGNLALGTWQGVYLWEHRERPHRRDVLFTLLR